MSESFAHERFLDHLMRNFMSEASSGYCAFCKAHREGQRPRCPIRRHTGNEDVAPPVWLNLARKLLADGEAKSCAKLTGRRFAALEPSGAAGWATKVLHGTPGMAKRHSVRMSRHEVWPEGQTRANESPLTGRTDERAMIGRDPKNTFPPIPMRSASRARSARSIAIRDVNPPKPHPYP